MRLLSQHPADKDSVVGVFATIRAVETDGNELSAKRIEVWSCQRVPFLRIDGTLVAFPAKIVEITRVFGFD